MTLRKTFADFGMKALLLWMADCKPPVLFERSLRLQPETVECRRCLFSFPTAALGDSSTSEVLQICHAMSSPEHLRQSIQRFFRGANHVHFGFEISGSTAIGKCYMELGPVGSADPNSPRLKFLGFKWSMNDDSVAVVSRYRTLPIQTWDQLTQTMQQNIQGDFQRPLSALLNRFQPTGDASLGDLGLLEVEEEGSDRKSYDLNVYARERSVPAVADSIRTVAASLTCDEASLESWILSHSEATVGHVAIGRSRTGHPFVTIYHSADLNAVVLE